MNAFRNGLNKIMKFAMSVMLVTMTLLVSWQVFTRYILKNPADWTEEFIIILLIWTSFIGAAYAFGTKDQMALVFLKEGLKGNKKKILIVSIDVIVLLFAVTILIFGGSNVIKTVSEQTTPILGISKGYLYLSLSVSGIITTIYQILNIAEDLKMDFKAEGGKK